MRRLASLFSLWLMTICVVCAQTVQEDSNTVKEPAVQYQEKINEVDAKSRELEASFKELSAHVSCLEYVVDKQKDLIAQEQSAIENGLTVSGIFLGIFSLVIAVVGIGLSVYISRKEDSMKELLEIVSQKQTEIESTGQRVEKLNSEIQNDMEGLYLRLRRNETICLLERLVEEPEDIDNLSSLLISRPLAPEDFDILLKAYTKLMDECDNTAKIPIGEHLSLQNQYLMVFFQHFCGKSIQNKTLKDDLINFFQHVLRCAFKSDVKNSLLSLIETLNNNTIEGGNDLILAQYIRALNNSQHKDYTEPYQLIMDNCKDSINLQSIWDNLVEKKVIIEPLGNLLCEKYKDDIIFTQRVKDQIATLHQEKKDAAPKKG